MLAQEVAHKITAKWSKKYFPKSIISIELRPCTTTCFSSSTTPAAVEAATMSSEVGPSASSQAVWLYFGLTSMARKFGTARKTGTTERVGKFE